MRVELDRLKASWAEERRALVSHSQDSRARFLSDKRNLVSLVEALDSEVSRLREENAAVLERVKSEQVFPYHRRRSPSSLSLISKLHYLYQAQRAQMGALADDGNCSPLVCETVSEPQSINTQSSLMPCPPGKPPPPSAARCLGSFWDEPEIQMLITQLGTLIRIHGSRLWGL